MELLIFLALFFVSRWVESVVRTAFTPPTRAPSSITYEDDDDAYEDNIYASEE
jgi:hypothetical protein